MFFAGTPIGARSLRCALYGPDLRVKWLSRIEFMAEQPIGYWEGLGYDQDAWVGHSNGYG